MKESLSSDCPTGDKEPIMPTFPTFSPLLPKLPTCFWPGAVHRGTFSQCLSSDKEGKNA